MQEMPFQDFKCPTCDHILNVRSIHGAYCPTKGCNWIEMIPIPHPMTMQPTTEPPSFWDTANFTLGVSAALFFLFYYVHEAYLWWLS